MFHASEESILKDIVGAVHPVGDLGRETDHRCLVARRRCDFRHDDGLLRVLVVHVLDISDGGVAVGPVVVHPEVVGRVAGDLGHERGNPGVAGVIAGAGRADELVSAFSQRHYLVVPGVCGLLRGDASALRLVEKVDDAVCRSLDDGPVAAGELPGIVDHGTERCAALELGWCPGVPVADGMHGTVEVDLVHLARAVIGVCVVPEETSFWGHRVLSVKGFGKYKMQCAIG